MGSLSIWHWAIVLAIVVLVFGGGGKIPKLMRDMGQGITAFKRGMKEDKDKVEAAATGLADIDGAGPGLVRGGRARGAPVRDAVVIARAAAAAGTPGGGAGDRDADPGARDRRSSAGRKGRLTL